MTSRSEAVEAVLFALCVGLFFSKLVTLEESRGVKDTRGNGKSPDTKTRLEHSIENDLVCSLNFSILFNPDLSSLPFLRQQPAYHAFIFFIPPLFRKATFRVPAAARAARSRWLDAVSAAPRDSATQTYAVQSIRNSIMAASFTASTCGLIAVSGLLPAILDGAKIGRLRELAALDPITRALSPSEKDKSSSSSPPLSPGWPSVEFKLSVMVRCLLCVCFVFYVLFSCVSEVFFFKRKESLRLEELERRREHEEIMEKNSLCSLSLSTLDYEQQQNKQELVIISSFVAYMQCIRFSVYLT